VLSAGTAWALTPEIIRHVIPPVANVMRRRTDQSQREAVQARQPDTLRPISIKPLCITDNPLY
jgi:hypothetical protein